MVSQADNISLQQNEQAKQKRNIKSFLPRNLQNKRPGKENKEEVSDISNNAKNFNNFTKHER